jgi:hypothetical protein
MILDKDIAERNGIWWLASYPKSGNTWMRMFINAAVTGFPPDINAAFQYAGGDHLSTVAQLTCAIKVTDQDCLESVWYRPAILLNHLALIYPRDACLKTHHANITLCDIALCPHQISKGAVYLMRDPRDVAISFAKHMGMDIDDSINAMNNDKMKIHRKGNPAISFHHLGNWSEHVRSWDRDNNPIPTVAIRYEDLHKDPEHWFGIALNALGLSSVVDKDRLRWAIDATKFKNLKEQEDQKRFKETGGKQDKFFNRGISGYWRDILSKDQVKRIEDNHCDIMQDFNYL